MHGWRDVPDWSVLHKKLHHAQVHVPFQHLREHASPCRLPTLPKPAAHLARYLPVASLLSPLHNNALLFYLVVFDSGLASERHLLEPPSAARGANPIPVLSYPLHNPGLCTELSSCWGGGNMQAFIPWSPSPWRPGLEQWPLCIWAFHGLTPAMH